jgi:NADH-quinone oxidoreductase subunit G
MTNEELHLARLLACALGTKFLSIVPRTGEPDDLLVAADRNPNTTGAKLVWQTDDPAANLDAIRAGIRAGNLKALLALGEDLVTDAGLTAADLTPLAFLLQTHTHANPTANTAHLVLPTSSTFEKRGSMINLTGRLQRLNRAVEPPGLARDDWEVLRDLVAAVEPASPATSFTTIEQVFLALAGKIPALHDLTLDKIGDLGVPVVDTGYQIPLLEKERARKAQGLIVG